MERKTLQSCALHIIASTTLAWLCYVLNRDIATKTSIATNRNATVAEKELADLLPDIFLHAKVDWTLRSILLLAAVLYGTYISAKVYRFLFAEANYVHGISGRDMGYHVAPGKSKKEILNAARKHRNIGDIPPPYPNGWYEVMRSRDLPRKCVKAVSIIGENFAVFRGENGKVSIVDAYCPHLGANLGVGGRVHGNCIECPFHGWQFDGESGQCVKIPYADKIPKFAKTKVWPSAECNELIYVWYDAEGRDPKYSLEEVEEIKTRQWTYRGRVVHYIAAHIEEISENGADVAHLNALHQPCVAAGGSVSFAETWLSKLLQHKWTAKWESKTESLSHTGHMSLHMVNTVLGIPLPLLDVHVESDQIGPSIVLLRFKIFLGRGVWIQTVVPEEPLYQRMTNYVFADWWIPTFAITAFLKGMGVQIDRDVNVWSNKTYLSKPLLVKEDRLILEHRRWYSQFYSESSQKFKFTKDKDLTW